MDEQLAQLKSEKQKSLDLAEQLQLSGMAQLRAQQVEAPARPSAPGSRDVTPPWRFFCPAAAGAAR